MSHSRKNHAYTSPQVETPDETFNPKSNIHGEVDKGFEYFWKKRGIDVHDPTKRAITFGSGKG